MYQLPNNISDYSYERIEDLNNKSVVIRSCLNVAVDPNGNITDPTRLYESLPLIIEMSLKAKNVIVIGHLGRPEAKMKVEERDPMFSFKSIHESIRDELSSLEVDVELVSELTEEVIERIQQQDNNKSPRKIYLLENIRYFPGEETKNKAERENFARVLSSLGDVFINDAFADYRKSASTYDIAKFSRSYLGPVFLKEIESLSKINSPERPFTAVLGGAKLSEKLDALLALCSTADLVLVGGAMAYTLLKAKDIEIGNSLCEIDKLEVAREIMQNYSAKILLPTDHLVSDIFNEENAKNTSTVVDDQNVPNGKVAIDLGPDTISIYSERIKESKTILWNGPMGVFEWPIAERGTLEIGRAIGATENSYKIAGGGDSIAAINKLQLGNFSHVSTGGGAMLAFIAYDEFPILDVIIKNK